MKRLTNFAKRIIQNLGVWKSTVQGFIKEWEIKHTTIIRRRMSQNKHIGQPLQED